jgi:PTH1 family peptidyl-tRNA hydrolase
MHLIVGLGNPGPSYERTRHNAGFLGADRVLRAFAPGASARQRFGAECAECTVLGERALVLKPMRFMNCSGQSVAEAMAFYKIGRERLLVLVDDYALALGAIRLRAGGGSGGHNGLRDIERALGTPDYPRLRIGIDPPPPTYADPADWVLGRFDDAQLKALDPALDRVKDACAAFVKHGLAKAMNTFNAKEGAGAPKVQKAPPASGAPGLPGAPANPARTRPEV